jgi:hypothetical protein
MRGWAARAYGKAQAWFAHSTAACLLDLAAVLYHTSPPIFALELGIVFAVA